MVSHTSENQVHTGLSSPIRGTGVVAWSLLLHLADSALILGQRNAEWTGHGPVLEQDIAITNIALDLIGQARNLYAHAAAVYNSDPERIASAWLPQTWRTFNRELQEDDLAYQRDAVQFRNLCITELPRGDWAFTTLRQFLFSAWQQPLLRQLQQAADSELAAIAAKSLKETAYHLRWSAEWVIRLGDGTEESNRRIHLALQELWPWTAELFTPTAVEQEAAAAGCNIDLEQVAAAWQQTVREVCGKAGLQVPAAAAMRLCGKAGAHSEHLEPLLAELQQLQRTYPNMQW